MSTLEEIKARAGINQCLGKTASQDEAKDTLKLIAALEAILYACTQVDTETNEAQQDWLVSTIGTVITEALE